MSETAATLIKSSLRVIGAFAPGETPPNHEIQDGLQAMKSMLRSWSARNLRLYFTTQESHALTGAAFYTIGTGGDWNTVRPVSIRSAYVRDSTTQADTPVKII